MTTIHHVQLVLKRVNEIQWHFKSEGGSAEITQGLFEVNRPMLGVEQDRKGASGFEVRRQSIQRWLGLFQRRTG